MQESFYPIEQSSVGSASLEPIVTPRHISKADILKRMLFRFNPTYSASLTKLIMTLIWLSDYISKCDNVVLVVIKETASSKNAFNCFLAARVKIC